ncbi:MAG TPA: hypothetical protein VJ770_24270 [Stellaceae bacterium]|nr:hypothetical protein [Stellaceae bacterium]
MADGRDSILEALFKEYGIWLVAAALVLGLVVWGASHLAAQPGTQVGVLWGMTSYTKSCNRDSEGACKEEKGRCASIAGRWQRSVDHLIVNYTQSGCIVQGYVESRGDASSSSDTSSHIISAVVSGNRAVGYVERIINGCATVMADEYYIISKDEMKIKAFGYGCGAPTREDPEGKGSIYEKIP